MPRNDITFAGYGRLYDRDQYPMDSNGKRMDLNPDSELHKKIAEHILRRAQESYITMSPRHKKWKEIDKKLTAYIDLSDEEKKTQSSLYERGDSRKPVSIVVPVAYATMNTVLTYWLATFGDYPILKYKPSADPDDTLGVIMLEKLVEQDSIRSKVLLSLYTMWRDNFAYGFGPAFTTWTKKYVKRTRREPITFGPFTTAKNRTITERVIQYEGNELVNIDPYNALPDPSRPIHDVESMDFFGWVERTSINALLSDERDDPDIFNVRYLTTKKDKKAWTSKFFSGGASTSGRYKQTDIQPFGEGWKQGGSEIVDVIRFPMKIIPKDLGLGKSEYPEIWMFSLAGDRVLIQAQPMKLDHDRIPVACISTESDGHSTVPPSFLEIEYPMQHAIDWLWSSHQSNVRRSINNMIIYDPSIINSNDMVDSKGGLLARTRAQAWGRPVKDSVFQLNVQDVTRGHVEDIATLMEIDNRVMGISPSMQGFQQRRGERVSASEAKDTRISGLSRLEKAARISAMQGHYDIGYMFASNTIQLLTQERYVELTGRWEEVLRKEYGYEGVAGFRVDPMALNVDFDVVVGDGSLPGGEYADTWVQLLQIASAYPEVYQELDMVRVFKHVARMLGAKNVNEFIKKGEPKVMSPENINKQEQAGNIVPYNQVGGGNV